MRSNKTGIHTTPICLSARSIVHLTAQIQNMETRVANFESGGLPHINHQTTNEIKQGPEKGRQVLKSPEKIKPPKSKPICGKDGIQGPQEIVIAL